MEISREVSDDEVQALRAMMSRRRRHWKRWGIVFLLCLLADFLSYQLYGSGLIFGNVLTIHIQINARLHGP